MSSTFSRSLARTSDLEAPSQADLALVRIRRARAAVLAARDALEAATKTRAEAHKAFNQAVLDLDTALDDQATLPFGGGL